MHLYEFSRALDPAARADCSLSRAFRGFNGVALNGRREKRLDPAEHVPLGSLFSISRRFPLFQRESEPRRSTFSSPTEELARHTSVNGRRTSESH